MSNLFYSPSEKIAFYIPDYYPDTLLVNKQIEMLTKETIKFEVMLLKTDNIIVDTNKICSREIEISSRYKRMRVWWLGEINVCPLNAFEIGNDWTMDKWIKY